MVGANHEPAFARLEALARAPAVFVRTSVRSAEMMKYACNNFHALKITFANETARACALGVDPGGDGPAVPGHTAEHLRAYPGPAAFGGPARPRPVATSYLAKKYDVELPMLGNVLASNDAHLDLALQRCWPAAVAVGFIGLCQDWHR